MKEQVRKLAALAAMAMVLAVTTATAQSRRGISVEVPFGFVANGTVIEPGRYVIETRPRGAWEIIEIRSSDGRPIMNVRSQSLSGPAVADAQPKLVFNRYEGGNFLTEIWFNGRDGSRVPAGKAELQLRAAGSTPSMVSVKSSQP
jgi:hypothetical protein